MFDIVDSDIVELGDAGLRELVTRLAEAELYRANAPLNSITAGGHQDASDGGIDVRVSIVEELPGLDFIPRNETGFQVKLPDMPASEIRAEMRPGGSLRESIQQLAEAGGAYVIISATGSVADSAYKRRVKAMRDALADSPYSKQLHVDFYDRSRLARWTNQYPGIMFWLRERIGKSLRGWRPYAHWAHGDTPNSPYVFDKKLRLVNCNQHDQLLLAADKGIDALRTLLANPNGIVRLVGLSGVGKTKLAHALFDRNVGTCALDSSLVVYTDEGDEPEPSPRDMIHQLGAHARRTILIVDNCKPDTHRALTHLVQQCAPQVSLMTIEYDLSDDDPEGTSVFRLEPASDAAVDAILEQLMPQLNHVDRTRIANFSSGNARIALALARNVQRGDSLARLTDAELFKRLFEQRNVTGENLMRAAEICSLVYSFDGETLDGENSELVTLAGIAELTVTQVHGYVEQLHRRDLVQHRSRWRAVLPHAIANSLAKRALENIPFELLVKIFFTKGRERLLRSFSRRLGYLHDSSVATRIAENWLSDPLRLQNVESLNELARTMFQNLAPLVPQAALVAIEQRLKTVGPEKFFAMDVSSRHSLMRMLRNIAFEATLFDRAVTILARFHGFESRVRNNNTMRECFLELFQIQLSGTHAPQSQRMQLISNLIDSEEDELQATGLAALEAMLNIWHLGSFHNFSFGARPRDYGWSPTNAKEVADWFRHAVSMIDSLIAGNSPHHEKLKSILAGHFRGLWKSAGIDDELESMASRFASAGGWPEGWLAVRSVLAFDGKDLRADEKARVEQLEIKLRPSNLLAKIHAFILMRSSGRVLDVADLEAVGDEANAATSYERADNTAVSLGKSAALDQELLKSLYADLLVDGDGRRWQFGTGLALATADPIALWADLVEALSAVPKGQQGFQLLRGFISGLSLRDANLLKRVMDDALVNPQLVPWFPVLQCSVGIDETSAERLLQSLTQGFAPIEQFGQMMYGGVAHQIPAALFEQLVLGIAKRPKGFRVAIDVFSMRIHNLVSTGQTIDLDTKSLGRKLLSMCNFSDNHSIHAYHVNEAVEKCLVGSESADIALVLCCQLAKEMSGHSFAVGEYGAVVATLFELQPKTALHVFLGGGRKRKWEPMRYRLYSDAKSPVNSAPAEIVLAWAKVNPRVRFPRLACEIEIMLNDVEKGLMWAPLALAILEQCPDRRAVLDGFSTRLHPRHWSGSLADVLGPYQSLVTSLAKHHDPIVVAWSKATDSMLRERIQIERARDKRVDESFE